MNAKPGIVIFLSLLLLLIVFIAATAAKVFAQDDQVRRFDSLEEAVAWLEGRGLAVHNLQTANEHAVLEVQPLEVVDACSFPVVSRNQSHNYPLDQNTSEVVVFLTSWCAAENRVYMTAGSDWWGNGQKQQRLWGLITIRFSVNDLFDTVYAFDISNTPDVDLMALSEEIARQFKLGSGQRRIIFEGNVSMEGGAPATKILETLITPEFGAVEVKKVDQDGNPVSEIVFNFFWKEGEIWIPLVSQTTNQQGRVFLDNLVEGVKYRGVEDLDSLPNGSKPLENGTFEFQVSTENPVFTVTVVNMIPRNIFLPIVIKQAPPEPPPACPRQGVMTYLPRGSSQQITTNLEFNFGSAIVQSIPVLQDGSKLSIKMADGWQVDQANLRWAKKVDPDRQIGYSDLPLGPNWNFYTASIGGELNIDDLYWFSAYYNVQDGICVTELMFQFDP